MRSMLAYPHWVPFLLALAAFQQAFGQDATECTCSKGVRVTPLDFLWNNPTYRDVVTGAADPETAAEFGQLPWLGWGVTTCWGDYEPTNQTTYDGFPVYYSFTQQLYLYYWSTASDWYIGPTYAKETAASTFFCRSYAERPNTRCPEEAASYRATFMTDKQSYAGPFNGPRGCVDSCSATWDTDNAEQNLIVRCVDSPSYKYESYDYWYGYYSYGGYASDPVPAPAPPPVSPVPSTLPQDFIVLRTSEEFMAAFRDLARLIGTLNDPSNLVQRTYFLPEGSVFFLDKSVNTESLLIIPKQTSVRLVSEGAGATIDGQSFSYILAQPPQAPARIFEIHEQAVLHLDHVHVTNGEVSTTGGGGSPEHLDQCAGISPTAGGGCFLVCPFASLQLTHSNASNCDSGTWGPNRGGGIFSGGRVYMEHSSIREGKSFEAGGCIAVDNSAFTSVAISDSVFENCEAIFGGGISLGGIGGPTSTPSTITNTLFRRCRAVRDPAQLEPVGRGGALHVYSSVTLSLSFVTIEETFSMTDGGAVQVGDCSSSGTRNTIVSFSDVIIRRARAQDDGGGVSVTCGGAVTMRRTLIEDCEARGGGGGGINVDDVTASLTLLENTRIVNSRSRDGDGGCMYLGAGAVSMRDVTLEDCYAARYGGAISSLAIVTASRIRIARNSAGTGAGAVSTAGGSLTMSDSDIVNCTGLTRGNALRILRGAEVHLTLVGIEHECSIANEAPFLVLTDTVIFRGIQDELTGCTSLTKGESAVPPPLPTCTPNTCGIDAVCSDLPVADTNQTIVFCECAGDSFPLPTAASAKLAPYEEGCGTPVSAQSPVQELEEMFVELSKTLTAAETGVATAVVRIDGTGFQPLPFFNWTASLSENLTWASLPESSGFISQTTGDVYILVDFDSSGVAEGVHHTDIDILFNLATVQRFRMPVRLSVQSTAVAANTRFADDFTRAVISRQCSDLVAEDLRILPVTDATAFFVSCDFEDMIVAHAIPDESDTRSFRAQLAPVAIAAGSSTAPTVVPIRYQGDGRYAVDLRVSHPGEYALQLFINAQPAGAPLTVNASCPSYPVQESADGASCVCTTDFIPTDPSKELPDCVACPAGKNSQPGDTECIVLPPSSPPPSPPPALPPPPATPIVVEETSLFESLSSTRNEPVRGRPVVLDMDDGIFYLSDLEAVRSNLENSSFGFIFDNSLLATEIRMIGTGFTRIVMHSSRRRQLQSQGTDEGLTLFRTLPGSPNVVFQDVQFDTPGGRVLLAEGGSVSFRNVRFNGATALGENGGALLVTGGAVECTNCTFEQNSAGSGGAVAVEGSGTASFTNSLFAGTNSARQRGGSLYIDGAGTVALSNMTLIRGNPEVPETSGRAIYLHTGDLTYTLPAPLGHWVEGFKQTTARPLLDDGYIDSQYPYECAPGLLGETFAIEAQSSPGCSSVCPEGYKCSAGSSQAEKCGAGYYCPLASSRGTPCEAGTYSSAEFNAKPSDCMTCSAGNFCPSGSVRPSPCAAGKFASNDRAQECTACPAGTYQNAEGRLSCLNCTAGHYCEEGAVTPTPCPAGTWSNTEGETSSSACANCARGYYCVEGATAESPCPAGTFGGSERLSAAEECTQCAAKSTSRSGSQECNLCIVEFFSWPAEYDDGALTCQQCPAGTTCTEDGITVASLVLDPGQWRLSENSIDIYDCVFKDDERSPCLGGNFTGDNGQGYCKFGYQGPLCEVCSNINGSQYFNSQDGECQECPNIPQTLAIIFAIFVAVATVLAAVYFIYHHPPARLSKFQFFLQRLVIRASSLSIVPKLKILIAFYQSVNAFPTVYAVNVPSDFGTWIDTFDWLRFDWTYVLVPGDCMHSGYAGRLLLRGLVPLGLMGVVFLFGPASESIYAFIKTGSKPSVIKVKESMLRMLNTVLFISFCLVVSVSQAIFSAWSCVPYIENSFTGEKRYFLRESPDIECDSGEHRDVQAVAYSLMAIWPIGMPLLYAGLLLWTRESIVKRKLTRSVQSISFLHREYQSRFYWMEPVYLSYRLIIGGYLLLIPARIVFIRVIAGLLLSIVFMSLLMLVQPYKRFDMNGFAVVAQFGLVGVFVGSCCIQLFQSIEDYEYACPEEDGTSIAVDVMGFSSAEQILLIMIMFSLLVFIIFVIATSLQAVRNSNLPQIRFQHNKELPELSFTIGCLFHLFLSHVWSSGQDQAATIKRQLQLLLPGVKVFLDVDDLHDLESLESHVNESQCVLIFLSKGYFFSKNCQRELDAALLYQKPFILVHEANLRRGGAPLESLMDDCSQGDPEKSDRLFNGKVIIQWHRLADYQLVSLKMIAQGLLMATPLYKDKKELKLYVPGELGRKLFMLKSRKKVYVSDFNPGASAVVDELTEHYTMSDKLDSSNVPPDSLVITANRHSNVTANNLSCQRALSSALSATTARPRADSVPRSAEPISLSDAAIEITKPSKPVAPRNASIVGSHGLRADNGDYTHMLLYLNSDTFHGEAGAFLAEEVRMARHHALPILMVHETDPERLGCEFDEFFRSTPNDLISQGLYSSIAIEFAPEPHRFVSYALLAKLLGAVPAKGIYHDVVAQIKPKRRGSNHTSVSSTSGFSHYPSSRSIFRQTTASNGLGRQATANSGLISGGRQATACGGLVANSALRANPPVRPPPPATQPHPLPNVRSPQAAHEPSIAESPEAADAAPSPSSVSNGEATA